LDDKEIWKNNKFEAKIYHIPGHTSGHVCYHFFNQIILFTGDTLFSLGCGRIFEGTYEEMFSSLQLIKSFPGDTKIYCGHEYTLKNSEFCIKHDENNPTLKEKIKLVKTNLEKGLPTIPTTIKEELECNIFLRSKDVQSFSKLRDLKDNF
jgi:hydroxyacylglutathione hydrolase